MGFSAYLPLLGSESSVRHHDDLVAYFGCYSRADSRRAVDGSAISEASAVIPEWMEYHAERNLVACKFLVFVFLYSEY